ncbi:MAG: phosphoesterase PA-phosphatase related protein [Frankiales bacterium]|nr:phosphoesterase PA-phosphatase related protein [Frankiales bacterium]
MADPSTFADDRSLFLSINDWARDTPWLHGVLKAYAGYGVVLFGVLLVAGYVLARRSRDLDLLTASLWAAIAPLLAVAINQPIASAVGEPRPFAVFPHALLLAHRSADPSFTSDHATMAGAIAIGLFLVSRRLGAVAAAAAVLMAFARVYVGAHYPVDVVAGLVLGGAVAGLGWLLLHRPLRHLLGLAARTPLRVAVPVAPDS